MSANLPLCDVRRIVGNMELGATMLPGTHTIRVPPTQLEVGTGMHLPPGVRLQALVQLIFRTR
jgi:hypothetical protein